MNSIVVPIYKTREKTIFGFGVHLNPPPLTWSFALLAKNRLKMTTGRKWCSWLKWSKFYVHQLSWHHIPPDSIQSHPDNPQTPPRQLPDTLQTPQNIAHFDQSEATGRKGRRYFKMSLIWCYQWLVHHTLPDSIQSHSDNPQTPPRHLPDTLQTPQNMAHFN